MDFSHASSPTNQWEKIMAEGRMLKKRISTSDKFAKLKNHRTRLLYLMMLPHLDIKGRIDANPLIIKGLCVPLLNYSTKLIENCVQDMKSVKLIEIKTQNGHKYLTFTRFHDFQQLRADRESRSSFDLPSLLQEDDGIAPDKDKLSKDKLSKDKRLWLFWNRLAKHDRKAKPLTLRETRRFTEKLQSVISTRLKEYDFKEIRRAIWNFRQLLRHPRSKWTYRDWGILEFLTREKDNVSRFRDWEMIEYNFIKAEDNDLSGDKAWGE